MPSTVVVQQQVVQFGPLPIKMDCPNCKVRIGSVFGTKNIVKEEICRKAEIHLNSTRFKTRKEFTQPLLS